MVTHLEEGRMQDPTHSLKSKLKALQKNQKPSRDGFPTTKRNVDLRLEFAGVSQWSADETAWSITSDICWEICVSCNVDPELLRKKNAMWTYMSMRRCSSFHKTHCSLEQKRWNSYVDRTRTCSWGYRTFKLRTCSLEEIRQPSVELNALHNNFIFWKGEDIFT